MKPTIEKALPAFVPDEDISDFTGGDLLTIVRAMRDALNYQAIEKTTVTTDGTGAYFRLWTSIALPVMAAWVVDARVVGTGVSVASPAAGYALVATFRSDVGTVSQLGTTTTVHVGSSAGAVDVRFGVDTDERQVYLEARDDAVDAVVFVGVIKVTEAAI